MPRYPQNIVALHDESDRKRQNRQHACGRVASGALLQKRHLDVPVGNAQPMAVVDRYDKLLEQPPRVRLRYAHLHSARHRA